jgi:hypothetical protein
MKKVKVEQPETEKNVFFITRSTFSTEEEICLKFLESLNLLND